MNTNLSHNYIDLGRYIVWYSAGATDYPSVHVYLTTDQPDGCEDALIDLGRHYVSTDRTALEVADEVAARYVGSI